LKTAILFLLIAMAILPAVILVRARLRRRR